MENFQKTKSFSEIWLWKPVKFAIIFWPARIFFHPFSLKKDKNPQISHFLKYGPDKGDGGVDGDGENFNIENFSENEMAYSQHV